MKNVVKYSLCVLLAVFVFYPSCKKTDFGKAQPDWLKPFKPSFTIYEAFYGSSRQFSTDTIIGHYVSFSPDVYVDSCKWIIGNDPRVRTGRSITVTFSLDYAGQTFPVTCIAYWYGKSDTVRKKFTVMGLKKFDEAWTPHTVDPPYVGKFLGSFVEDPSHKFEVSIVNFGPYPPGGILNYWGEFRIFNLPEGCGANFNNTSCVVDTISPYRYAYDFQTAYRAFYVNTLAIAKCCPPAVMYGYMDSVDHNKIIIEYNQLQNTNSHIDTILKRKFIGYRE